MTEDPVFTILTTTYNRCDTLRRAFQSLTLQGFDSFEWLIVDDGSEDNTEDLVRQLQDEASFPIRYVRQENRGKYVAWNCGIEAATGQLVAGLDSDDEYLPGALRTLWKNWLLIPAVERASYVGITGLCVTPQGKVIGDVFPSSPFDSDSTTVGLKLAISGDKAGFCRRDVLLDHPFPEHLPTKFIPEGRIWIDIAQSYKTRFVNENILIVHPGGGARLSQLTRLRRAHGDLEYNSFALSAYATKLLGRPIVLIKLAILVSRAGLTLGRSLSEIVASVSGGLAKMLVILAYPAGAIAYARDLVGAFGSLGILVAISRSLPHFRLSRKIAGGIRRLYVRRDRPPVTVPVFDFQMLLEPNECVDGWALFHPQMFDPRGIEFCKSLTLENGVFVDVGANIGLYSLRLSRHLRQGRVLSIEADPYNAAKLRRNIELSDARNITVFEGGVADRKGALNLTINTTGNRGGNSFSSSPGQSTISVQCLPLLSVLEMVGITSVQCMKLDIEGFEYPVLEAFFASAEQHLWPAAVVIEVEPDLVAGARGDVLSLLRDHGYRIVDKEEANFMLVRST